MEILSVLLRLVSLVSDTGVGCGVDRDGSSVVGEVGTACPLAVTMSIEGQASESWAELRAGVTFNRTIERVDCSAASDERIR